MAPAAEALHTAALLLPLGGLQTGDGACRRAVSRTALSGRICGRAVGCADERARGWRLGDSPLHETVGGLAVTRAQEPIRLGAIAAVHGRACCMRPR